MARRRQVWLPQARLRWAPRTPSWSRPQMWPATSIPSPVAVSLALALWYVVSSPLTASVARVRETKPVSQIATQVSVPYDYNGLARNSCFATVGAYQYSTASNPGFIWTVASPFKTVSGTNQCTSASCTVLCCGCTAPPTTTATTTGVTTSGGQTSSDSTVRPALVLLLALALAIVALQS